MSLLETYRDTVVALLDRLVAGERTAIGTAEEWVAETFAADRLVYVTGSGHSHMLAEEVFYRAGGAAPVQAILIPPLMLHEGAEASSRLERVEGYAAQALADYAIGGGDVLFVVSNSGRNAFPIEAALFAKARGARIIALTSLAAADAAASRHSSGRKLHEVADLVIDSQVPPGDAALPLPARGLAMGPVSTIAGVFVLNAIMAGAVERLAQAGKRIDVYRSANVEGSDAAAVAERWRGRIKGL
jgi:uncharacterized phosphosugar-binding protein